LRVVRWVATMSVVIPGVDLSTAHLNFAIDLKISGRLPLLNCAATTHHVHLHSAMNCKIHTEILQNATSDTHTAAGPLHTRLSYNISILHTSSRRLCIRCNSFRDNCRATNSPNLSLRSTNPAIPSLPAALLQAARGPQDAVTPTIPVCTAVFAIDPDIST
jgi:hypothetical protein